MDGKWAQCWCGLPPALPSGPIVSAEVLDSWPEGGSCWQGANSPSQGYSRGQDAAACSGTRGTTPGLPKETPPRSQGMVSSTPPVSQGFLLQTVGGGGVLLKSGCLPQIQKKEPVLMLFRRRSRVARPGWLAVKGRGQGPSEGGRLGCQPWNWGWGVLCCFPCYPGPAPPAPLDLAESEKAENPINSHEGPTSILISRENEP